MSELPTLPDLPELPDVIAPDGSEIRFLNSPDSGSSMVHATLRLGSTTQAVRHRTVEESWVCVGGQGELWRSVDQDEGVLELNPGITCDIPLGTKFQFRATHETEPLEIVITTTPPWPGEQEAIAVDGKWKPTV